MASADEQGTTSTLLNQLAHDVDTKIADVSTAATTDLFIGYDFSAGIIKKYDALYERNYKKT